MLRCVLASGRNWQKAGRALGQNGSTAARCVARPVPFRSLLAHSSAAADSLEQTWRALDGALMRHLLHAEPERIACRASPEEPVDQLGPVESSFYCKLAKAVRVLITGGMLVSGAISLVLVWLADMALLCVSWPWDPHRLLFGRFFRRALSFAVFDLNPLWWSDIRQGDIPEEGRPGGSRVVFVVNHTSLSDIVLIVACIPWEMKFLSMGSLRSVPLLGQLMSIAGDVFVDFERNEEGRWCALNGDEAMDQCKQLVSDGVPVCIFPEGGLSRDGQMKAFKVGAFKIAVETEAEVVPIAISGPAQMLPPGATIFGSATGRVKVGKSFSTKGMSASEASEIASQRIHEMKEELDARAHCSGKESALLH